VDLFRSLDRSNSDENQPRLVEAISQMNIQGWLPKPIDPGEMAEKILQVAGY
jgi:hypothetical protein